MTGGDVQGRATPPAVPARSGVSLQGLRERSIRLQHQYLLELFPESESKYSNEDLLAFAKTGYSSMEISNYLYTYPDAKANPERMVKVLKAKNLEPMTEEQMREAFPEENRRQMTSVAVPGRATPPAVPARSKISLQGQVTPSAVPARSEVAPRTGTQIREEDPKQPALKRQDAVRKKGIAGKQATFVLKKMEPRTQEQRICRGLIYLREQRRL